MGWHVKGRGGSCGKQQLINTVCAVLQYRCTKHGAGFSAEKEPKKLAKVEKTHPGGTSQPSGHRGSSDPTQTSAGGSPRMSPAPGLASGTGARGSRRRVSKSFILHTSHEPRSHGAFTNHPFLDINRQLHLLPHSTGSPQGAFSTSRPPPSRQLPEARSTPSPPPGPSEEP